MPDSDCEIKYKSFDLVYQNYQSQRFVSSVLRMDLDWPLLISEGSHGSMQRNHGQARSAPVDDHETLPR